MISYRIRTIYIIFFLWFMQISFSQIKEGISPIQTTTEKNDFLRYKNLGDYYYEKGYISKAIENYQKALLINQDNDTQRKLAKAWNRKGYTAKAIKIYRSILSNDSTNTTVRYSLAALLVKNGKIEEAKKLFYALEKYDNNNPDYSYQLGQLEKNINKKLDAYLRSYHKDTTLIKSIYKITQLYRLFDNYKDSAKYFMDKGLQLSPNHFGLLRFKVIDFYRNKKYNKMVELLTKIDSIYPQKLFVKKNLGLAYLQLNRLKKSEKYLLEAKKIDEEPIIYYYLGLLYFKQKKYEKAHKMNLIAINKKKVSRNKEYYQLGLIEKKLKHYKRALEYFYSAYKENKSDYLSLFEWAVLSDGYFKDRKIVIKRYEKYLLRFEKRNTQKTMFIKNRLKEIKNKTFMDK